MRDDLVSYYWKSCCMLSISPRQSDVANNASRYRTRQCIRRSILSVPYYYLKYVATAGVPVPSVATIDLENLARRRVAQLELCFFTLRRHTKRTGQLNCLVSEADFARSSQLRRLAFVVSIFFVVLSFVRSLACVSARNDTK